MHVLLELRDMLCRELEEFAKNGEINGAKELDAIDKLTHSIKSIETILAMQDAEYAYDDGSYRGSYRGSYADCGYSRARYQRRDSRGRYASYDDGYSGRRSYDMDYRRSRDDAKDQLMEQMKETMNSTSSEETKEALRKAIQMMEKE